ncbi:MAG: DUF3048 C-terminal domain-containing protein, partial [Bacillota bacterium]|nr:DUF3048 C-terminal domain-containing protein [Bacillota bacterium]
YADTKVIDGEGRLDVKVVGTGKALVFTNGQVYEAVWKKDNKQSRTTYTTADGQEIPLSPGQTWVQVVRHDTNVTY